MFIKCDSCNVVFEIEIPSEIVSPLTLISGIEMSFKCPECSSPIKKRIDHSSYEEDTTPQHHNTN